MHCDISHRHALRRHVSACIINNTSAPKNVSLMLHLVGLCRSEGTKFHACLMNERLIDTITSCLSDIRTVSVLQFMICKQEIISDIILCVAFLGCWS